MLFHFPIPVSISEAVMESCRKSCDRVPVAGSAISSEVAVHKLFRNGFMGWFRNRNGMLSEPFRFVVIGVSSHDQPQALTRALTLATLQEVNDSKKRDRKREETL
jgi:hypothetical protein